MSNGPLIYTDEQLASIDHEVLVVHGREDQMIPFDSSLDFARRIPNAQLRVFPNAGHWVQIEVAERFVALVAGFLAES